MRTKFNGTIEYGNYKKLINYIAREMQKWGIKKYGKMLDIEELQSEGNLIFVKAKKNYKPAKGVYFSTYLYTCVSNGLKNYIKTTSKWIHEELEITIQAANHEYEKMQRVVELQKGINKCSPTAKMMINMTLDGSYQDILHLSGNESIVSIRAAMVKHMKKEQKKSRQYILNAVDEIKAVLRN